MAAPDEGGTAIHQRSGLNVYIMLIKTRGICLHTSKYGETSVIAQVYTEEKGLQSYIISGVRSAKPRVHGSLLQPLTMLDMVAYWRAEKSLFRTKELRAAYTFERIPFELARGSVALFVADVLLRALRESEAPPDLFPFVERFIVFLDVTTDALANLPTYFLLQLSSYLGVQPETPLFGGPYYFDQTQGYFAPEPPEHLRYTDPEASGLLVSLAGVPLEGASEVASTKAARQGAIVGLLDYLREHFERFSGVNSHRVLTDIFRR